MKGRKRFARIALIVLLGGICAFAGIKVLFASIETNLVGLKDLSYSNIDISNIKDGIYSGSYKAFPIAAEVKVSVNDHKIEAIELVKHNNGQGAAAEIIPSKVVEAQSLDVDIVSGATYSSKVILKAIENALIGTNNK